MENIKVGKQFREFIVARNNIDSEKRTVSLSFSSETPVERWFGYEILDHSEGAVDLKRLKRGGALLIDHEPRNQVGVIEEVLIDGADRKGRAIVRFGRSAKAEEIFQDVLDEIRVNVSVGYQVHELKLEKEVKDGPSTYRATKWEPLEISFVSIPADLNTGVGRENNISKEVKVMSEEVKDIIEVKQPDLRIVKEEGSKEERQRVAEILAIGEKYKCLEIARRYITEGKSIEDFKTMVLETVFKAEPLETDASIGLTEREIKQFSFVRAINAAASGDWSKAGFEKECSLAVSDRMKRQSVARGFSVPYDILQAEVMREISSSKLKEMKRDLTVGSASAGGYLVAENLLASSFIELLRNRMMVRAMGAQILGGLTGDIAIPKQTGGASAYWVSENGAPTESQQTLGQIGLKPKTVGAFTDYSRKLTLQSSLEIENFVRNDLSLVLALAIDLAAINGSGVEGQPLGILNVTGIGSVAGGTNGAAPTWAHMINLWKEIAKDNAAFGTLGYLSNSDMIGKLMTVEKASNTGQFVVMNFPDVNGFTSIGGARCGVSNQVPNNLTKGSGTALSAIIMGNWADLLIAEWGVIDVLVDPYTGGAAGTTRVRILQDVDMAVRHAESFAAMVDAITT